MIECDPRLLLVDSPLHPEIYTHGVTTDLPPALKVSTKGRTSRVKSTNTWKMKAQLHTELDRYFLS